MILQLFDKAKGVIGIEENKPEAIRILSELVKDEPRIEVCHLKDQVSPGRRALPDLCRHRRP